MQSLRSILALALAGAFLPACSVLFDGSRFTNGTGGGSDAGRSDAGPPDSGPPIDCTADPSVCPSNTYCYVDPGLPGGAYCAPCDGDGDGFVPDRMECDSMGRPRDCDDGNGLVHPGALPICGNRIDESCGSMLPAGPGVPIDEFGFFASQQVSAPPGGSPGRIRVFVLDARDEGSQALVFFQLSDPRRTPYSAQVPLTADVGIAPDARPITDMGDPPFSGPYWYDAQRSQAGEIRLAMIGSDPGGDVLSVSSISFDRTGGWSNRGTFGHPTFDTTDMTHLEIDSHPSLVASGEQFFFGVPARRVGADGGIRGTEIRTLGVDGGHNDPTGPGYGAGSRWGSVSDGQHAAFAGVSAGMGLGDSVRIWNGSLDSGSGDELASVFPGTAIPGRPTINTLRSFTAGARRFAVLVPNGDSISAFVSDCADGSQLSSCGIDGLARIIAAFYTGDPLLVSVPVSASSIGVLMRTEARGSDELQFFFYETDDAEPVADVSPFPIPSPGFGPITDTDIDVQLTMEPTGAAIVTFAYAYIRQIDGMPGSLFVSGARACAGFGGP